MLSVARTRRTSEQIRAEIEQTFGFLPPFFEPALASPQVLGNLWQQTLSAYVENPLSALFKEKLNALLSRFCTAPYCIIVHSSALRPLGMTAQQVLALLEVPPSDLEAILPLGALPIPAPESAASPAPDSQIEAVLLYCATAVFLERAEAPACQAELNRLLGPDLYLHLVAYLAYIKTCHTWIECHPNISYEADQRAVKNLGPLLAEEPALGNFFRHYQERVAGVQRSRVTQAAVEADRERLAERERNIAQQLQDALQPSIPEYLPGLSVGRFTKPALDEAQIGGDFYDIFPLDKTLFAVVIGDVSGKGLAAAQQLALIRNSLRTTLYLYRTPALAAASLNGIVTAHDLLVGFVTVFVAVYDSATGEIVYCSCGHEPGLIRRAGGALEMLETTGLPLGVAENAMYSEASVALLSGDRLLLYTDGISEAGPSRLGMLGTEGLMRLFGTLPVSLEAQSEAETLVAEVGEFTEGVFRDDVAVLLMRRE